MHGGAGDRDDSQSTMQCGIPGSDPSLGAPGTITQSTSDHGVISASENLSAFGSGISSETSGMRWTSSEMEEADREEREAEMRFHEARAKRMRVMERLVSEAL